MTFLHTLAGICLQLLGLFSVFGGIAYLVLGLGSGVLTGGAGGAEAFAVLAILATFSLGIGLGFVYLGGLVRKAGTAKK